MGKRKKWILILKIVVVVVVGVADKVGCLVLFYSVILLKLIVDQSIRYQLKKIFKKFQPIPFAVLTQKHLAVQFLPSEIT